MASSSIVPSVGTCPSDPPDPAKNASPPDEQEDHRILCTCLCNRTSYRIKRLEDGRSPAQILVCHCSLCRKMSGALCTPFGAFPRDYVQFRRDEAADGNGDVVTTGVKLYDDAGAPAMLERGSTVTRDDHGDGGLRLYQHSEVATRLFCKNCGCTVGMDYGTELEPDTIWLALGLGLADDPRFREHLLR